MSVGYQIALRAVEVGSSQNTIQERENVKEKNLAVQLYRKLKSTTHERFCPCCGWSGHIFAPGGASNKADRFCPVCRSAERHRRICLIAGQQPHVFQSSVDYTSFRLLHFGPQPTSERLISASYPEVDQISLDYFAEGYGQSYRNTTLQADIQALGFPNNFAHGIVILHVLEHIRKLKAALDNIYNVLVPGGWLAYEVPCNKFSNTHKDCRQFNTSEKLTECGGQRDHVFLFSCSQMVSDITSLGFACDDTNAKFLGLTEREYTAVFPVEVPISFMFCRKE